MSDAEAFDAGNQAAVDNAAKAAARQAREDRETIAVWMNHPHGRDLLYRIIYETCHLGTGEFLAFDAQGRSDTHRTYVHIGERNIGALLDSMLRDHPDLYTKMLKEQQAKAELRASRIATQNEAANG